MSVRSALDNPAIVDALRRRILRFVVVGFAGEACIVELSRILRRKTIKRQLLASYLA